MSNNVMLIIGNISSEPESEISNVEYLTLPGRKKRVLYSAINHRDRSGRSLLYKCAGQGLAEAVQVLCEAGAEVNIKDNAGWSPLHEATVNGHEIVVKYLLEAGANVNCQGGNLDTPLHDAVESGHVGVVDLLLSHGASLELKNENGETAQDVTSDPNILQLLNEWRSNTAKVLTRYDDGKTLLHKAVTKGSVSSVLDCLKYGSDINARDDSAWTPLHEACLSGNFEMVELLLSYGAEIQPEALDNDTPLHQACANNFVEIVKILLMYGADPEKSDAHSRTPADLTVSEEIKKMLNAPKETYLPHKSPRYLPRLALEPMEIVVEESRTEENFEEPAFAYDDARQNSEASFASTREERKFQALLKKLEENEQKAVNRSGQKESKRYRKFGDDIASSSSESDDGFIVLSKKSKSDGYTESFSPSKSDSPVKKPYTGKPRGRKPKRESLGSVIEAEKLFSGIAPEIKSEASPRRPGRPPKNASRPKIQAEENSSDTENEENSKDEVESLKRSDAQRSTSEIIVNASPKKRGRKSKSWHLEKQKLIQQQELEKINQAAGETKPQDENVKEKSDEDVTLEEVVHHSPKMANAVPISPVIPTTTLKDNQKRPKSPIKPVFISPVVRKKAKKKSWIVSGYQSLESQVDQTGTVEEEEEKQEEPILEPLASVDNSQSITLFKKHCLPLYIITLPTSGTRYFLDIQLGLFLKYTSGRAFLDSIPGISTRIAATAEKQYLEQSRVSATIYSSMVYANESAARWIKTVALHAGHVGLKMTDLDIHFVKEDDIQGRLNSRIKMLQEQLDGKKLNFYDEIFIGNKEEVGHERRNLGKSSPTGGYVHKLKRHANKKAALVFEEVVDNFDEIPETSVATHGLWVDRYAPISVGELAVHKKKIDAVKNLLTEAFDKCERHLPGFKIIVLKGPSGVGKMATIRCLGREMGFEIHEWIDPTTAYRTFADENSRTILNCNIIGHSDPISTLFNEYLRSSLVGKLQYSAIGESNVRILKKQLLVVKDFPNLSNTLCKKAIHEYLIDFTQYSNSPLVILITDMKSHSFSRTDSSYTDTLLSVNSILPSSVRNSRFFAQINFNITAPSILLKALKRIVALEYRRGKKGPTSEQLEYLSNLGDIRKAINHLQFQNYEPIIRSSGKKILGQEPSAALFHALGKLLRNKRGDQIYNKLPNHLKHHERKEWNDYQPEELINIGHLESDMISLFLQENYLTYYSCMDDIESLTECMSSVDLFSGIQTRVLLEPYETSIMIRSILFWNQSNSISSIGWQKHFKPQIWDCRKKSNDCSSKIRDRFFDKLKHSSFASLSQLELPYEVIINSAPTRHDFLVEFNSFSTRRKHGEEYSGLCVEDDEDLMAETYQSFDNQLPELSKGWRCNWLEEDDIVEVCGYLRAESFVMRYRSTRSTSEQELSFEEAVIEGLAPDGGLFVPVVFPRLDEQEIESWRDLEFTAIASCLFRKFIDPSEISDSELEEIVQKSFSTFSHPKVTPLVKLSDDLWILELFHGPTFAFKDVALQVLGNLFEFFLMRRDNAVLNIIGATSGDTGGAAIYGLRGKKGIQAFILHPMNRISPIQELQMTTVLDANIHNVAVEGTFDDCQEIVKTLFSNRDFKKKYSLGAVNSINWARIMAQMSYYFFSYFEVQRLLGIKSKNPEFKIAYSVPTGNFGDVLAGFYAKELGLPINQLIIATNENDILYRFMETGSYEKLRKVSGFEDVKQTLSPAMDILISSNFERLLHHLLVEICGSFKKSSEMIIQFMGDLKSIGRFSVPQSLLQLVRLHFVAYRSTDSQTLDAIRRYYHHPLEGISRNKNYVLDPHTAVGVIAAEQNIKDPKTAVQTVVLGTASPGKFPSAVLSAINESPSSKLIASGFQSINFKDFAPKELTNLEELPKRCIQILTNGDFAKSITQVQTVIESILR